MDFSSLETWGYLAVAFFSFGGSFFIVAAAGVFSYMGHMDLGVALAIAELLGSGDKPQIATLENKD